MHTAVLKFKIFTSNRKRFDNYPDDSEGDYSFDKEKDNSLYARSKKDFSRNWSDRGNSYNKKDYGGIFRGREKSYGRDYELPLDRNFDHDFYNTKKTDFSTEQPIEKNFYEEHPDVTNRPQVLENYVEYIAHIFSLNFPPDINNFLSLFGLRPIIKTVPVKSKKSDCSHRGNIV